MENKKNQEDSYRSDSRSRSFSQENKKDRNKQYQKKSYSECCSKCSQSDKAGGKKTCICVVPADQRRNKIEGNGCKTCGCKGCSKQDFDKQNKYSRNQRSRSRDRDRNRNSHRNNSSSNNNNRNQRNEVIQNGCCKNCMKAFSASGKACICQVPENVRKLKIPSTGCNFCGCQGCNPEDMKNKARNNKHNQNQNFNNNNRQQNQQQQQRHNNNEDSDEEGYKNYFNIINSSIGRLVTQGMNINPLYQTGFGIPQRTKSYLQGRND